MSDSHQHAEVRALPESRLWLAFGLTGTYMVAEIIGGLVTGSLALISDAMHMMTDAIALLLALIAIRAGRKAADLLRTYGYARFEILAAAVNALVLLGVAFYILYEAYRRLVRAAGHPVPGHDGGGYRWSDHQPGLDAAPRQREGRQPQRERRLPGSVGRHAGFGGCDRRRHHHLAHGLALGGFGACRGDRFHGLPTHLVLLRECVNLLLECRRA